MAEASFPVASTPPRAMRRANRAVHDPAEVLGIIERCRTVRLGLRDEQGPFVVPMNFGYDWAAGSRAADRIGAAGAGPAEAGAFAAGVAETGTFAARAAGARAADDGAGPAGGARVAGAALDEPPRLTLWLHCASEGRKLDALRADPLVAFEMDVETGVIEGDFSCAYSFAYESVMGTGLARRVTATEEKLHGLERLMEHLAPERPVRFSEAAVERVVVLAVEVLEFSAKRRVC